jgi:hypothetical protein
MNSRAPLVVTIVLLLLPVLYVGSYLALVVPGYWLPIGTLAMMRDDNPNYRYGGNHSAKFFWPLEQVDRKLRPGAWGGAVIGLEYFEGPRLP